LVAVQWVFVWLYVTRKLSSVFVRFSCLTSIALSDPYRRKGNGNVAW
jgi:hypothetical protein